MGLLLKTKAEAKEASEAGRELWHFTRTHNWKASIKGSFRRKYLWWWVVGVLLTAFAVVVAIYRDPIVNWFEPRKADIIHAPASWLIPIVVLIILSFPPLGGHEIVLLVVGLIWGPWVGFGIACAGTFIGELACFFAFKYLATERAAKVEKKSIFYACLARLMRDGGLWIVTVVRFSAIPGHVVTALQSTVGMALWRYSIAVFLSLPKQLAVVYLGVMFGETSASGANQAAIDKKRRISLSVFFGTAFATVLALYIVYMRARKLYPVIVAEAEERKALAAAEAGQRPAHGHHDSTLVGAAWDGESIDSSLELDQASSGKDRVFSSGPHSYVLPAAGQPLSLEEARPPVYGASPYVPQTPNSAGWSNIEARERWQAQNDARYAVPPWQQARTPPPPTPMDQYPPGPEQSTTSFVHSPLQGSDYDQPYQHPPSAR